MRGWLAIKPLPVEERAVVAFLIDQIERAAIAPDDLGVAARDAFFDGVALLQVDDRRFAGVRVKPPDRQFGDLIGVKDERRIVILHLQNEVIRAVNPAVPQRGVPTSSSF